MTLSAPRGLAALLSRAVVACSADPPVEPPAPPRAGAAEPVAVARQAIAVNATVIGDDIDNGLFRFGGAGTQSFAGWSGACTTVPGDNRVRRMNVKFALGSIPACATVNSATLTLTHTGCTTCQTGGGCTCTGSSSPGRRARWRAA